jgi:flagellin-like hook-associated protein FlgL
MYLFGGTNLSGDIVSLDADGKAVISPEDFTGEMKVKISNTFAETMNVPGNKITSTGIFSAVNDIITSLSSNSAPTEAQVSALNNAYNKLVNVQSLAGEKITRLENVKTVLTNQKSNFEQMLNDIQGIDIAKLSTELDEQDYLLAVTLKLLSKSTSTSVLDYL